MHGMPNDTPKRMDDTYTSSGASECVFAHCYAEGGFELCAGRGDFHNGVDDLLTFRRHLVVGRSKMVGKFQSRYGALRPGKLD